MAYLGRPGATAPLTSADIPDNSITGAKIVEGTVAVGDIGTDAVGADELANNAVDTNAIADDAVTGAKIENNPTIAGNLTVSGNTTLTGDLVPSTPLSHRNMIINGAMQIDQRNDGAINQSIGATDNDYRSVDRWKNVMNNGDARISLQQVGIAAYTDLAGFPKALKIDCTTTGGTPGANEYTIMKQRIEGFNLQQMEKGFSSAKPVTLSFWVKGTASRTYVVELEDTSSTIRVASQQFSVTTSWVKHAYTFPGDTGGSKIPDDETNGLDINFWLSAGTNFTSGTYTAVTWANQTNANRAVGITNSGAGILQSTSDELYITGVQLELGSNATPFEHRSYADELQRCQRYFQMLLREGGDGNRAITNTNAYNATTAYGVIQYLMPMRTNITADNTVTTFNASSTWRVYGNGTNSDGSTLLVDTISGDSCRLAIGSVSLTQGFSYWLESLAAGQYITVENEL